MSTIHNSASRLHLKYSQASVGNLPYQISNTKTARLTRSADNNFFGKVAEVELYLQLWVRHIN